MPRSNITAKTTDVITDDGSILYSIVQGEQQSLTVNLAWISDLSGYTISAKIAEAQNAIGDGDAAPTEEDSSLIVTELPIVDDDEEDGSFEIVLVKDLADDWTVQPKPDDPVYGFFALQLDNGASGNAQRIFVPIRGLIEVRYNPVRSS